MITPRPEDSWTLPHHGATDPATERDVPNFCEFLGHALLGARREGDEFHYRIRKA